jgi:predicted phage terminase large subunit-like protein
MSNGYSPVNKKNQATAPFMSVKALARANRPDLLKHYEHCRQMEHEWLRRQILENNRIDILAIAILGYEVKPFHLAMLQYQFLHPDSMQLVFRGAGKSTLCTITKCIHYLCKYRDARILLASKTSTNAEAFLKEIKGHLEENTRLIELFGHFYDPRKVGKWDNKEIEVLGRTRKAKEASVTCVGVDGTIVSKHYDVILSDDLVDEDNSRTKCMRDKTRTWYYQTLDPCLEPPSEDVPHRGEHHRLGTRYHYDDLWGHLQENELREHTNIIPALDDHDRSPWPEKYPPEWFHKKREKAGTIIYRAQYECDTEAMKGEVFQYDDCQVIDDDALPKDMRIFMGVDLAISEESKSDLFAIVVGGIDRMGNHYVIDYYDGHLRFGAQTTAIKRLYKKHDPIRAGIEINAYQAAQYQSLKDDDRDIRLTPIYQDKDKLTRAWKLTPLFENKRMFFRRNMGRLIDQFVLFPNYRYKDGFDAFDLMVRASKVRKKRRGSRRQEPGVI